MSSGSQNGPPPGGSAAERPPANARTTPPTRHAPSPQPSQTPPMTTAPNSRPGSSHKAQKQTSSGSLNHKDPKAMHSAKSFETARSRTSQDSLRSRAIRTPEIAPLPNPKEELLKTLQSQFESLRQTVTCKICFGLLYEPYTTACGHTYCYECFCRTWQPNTIPACPECRGKLAHPPAPAYAVREMVHAFIQKQELLPAGETLEEHKKWQKEHADIIQKDKDNKNPRDGGLWRGFFRPRRPRMYPIHDYEDNVDRCPFCTWELEGGMCNRCGLPIDEDGNGDWEFSDMASEHPSMLSGQDIVIEDAYDEEDDFIDDEEYEGEWPDEEAMEYAEEMGYGHSFAIQRMLGGHRPRPASHSAAASRSRYSASVHESEMGTLEEEDEDEEDGDSSMSGFVVGDDAPVDFSRESTATSQSRSSRFPESIAEDDEEEEDDVPVLPGRRRNQRTISSTPTLTSRASQSRSQQQPSQGNRRRRVISETPSTESTSSASASAAAEEDDDDDMPVAAASRRRRRPLSQEEQEPARRVRPRPRGSSASQDSNEWGYRPLGANTPQIEEDDEELSDGGRTEVGWEPIIHANDTLRNTGSLTPTADRPRTPPQAQAIPRPPSRNTGAFPLGSRGIRRRSSTASIVRYEDNDADGESDTQVAPQPQLQPRTSRARLRNSNAQTATAANPILTPTNITSSEDTDSGDTETSPQNPRHPRATAQRRNVDPYLAMILNEHRSDLQTAEPENEEQIYAEFAHLRGIARTPTAIQRPRTSNRNRSNNATPQSAAHHAQMSPARAVQPMYSPMRARGTAELMHAANDLSRQMNAMTNSPRNSISGPSGAAARMQAGIARQHSGNRPAIPSQLSQSVDPRLQAASNAALMQSIQSSMTQGYGQPMQARQNMMANGPQSPRLPQMSDVMDRPASRVSYRGGYAAPQSPAQINRPNSGTSRPPSAGSRRGSLTRSPFAAPPMPTVGLGTARAWHPSNPFYNGVRRVPSQRLRQQGSNHTLRPQGSIRVMRQAPPPLDIEPDQTSPQMRPSASRMHLRPQPSYGRMRITRTDPNMIPMQYQQVPIVPPAQTGPAPQRYSPSSASSTLSEDERSRRAADLVRTRLQVLAEQQRNNNPAAAARLSAADQQRINAEAQQRIRARLDATIGRLPGIAQNIPNAAAVANAQRNATAPAVSNAPQQQPAAISSNRMNTNRPPATVLPSADPQSAPAVMTNVNRPQLNSQSPTLSASANRTQSNTQASSSPIGMNRPALHPEVAAAIGMNRPQPGPQTASPTITSTRPQVNSQPLQRAPAEQQSSRANAPSMAQGMTAITTAGDARRN